MYITKYDDMDLLKSMCLLSLIMMTKIENPVPDEMSLTNHK